MHQFPIISRTFCNHPLECAGSTERLLALAQSCRHQGLSCGRVESKAILRMLVDAPPKISDVPAKIVTVEALPPLVTNALPPKSSDGPPIHALSALVLAAVDNLWLAFAWEPPFWIVAIPLCFAAVFVPTLLIQKYLKHDGNGRAVTFATLLGVLAAIPIPITGTAVGISLLAWTGLGKLIGRTRSR
jgi:hypothetical protein